MSHTHSPAEWAAMGSLSIGLYASASVLYFLLVDADRADFDPRPAVRRAMRSEAMYPLLREWDNARHTARETAGQAREFALLSLRETALTAAALLMLLTASEATR